MSPATPPQSAASPSSGGGLHVRSNSIKRTPSDLSLALANADLPPPSAITKAAKDQVNNDATAALNKNLGDLDLQQPEALTLAERQRENDRHQEAVAAALSGLELGAPERITRANAKADGATTPIPPERTEGQPTDPEGVPLSPGGSAAPTFPSVGETAAAAATVPAAGAQVVTPWDVQGAVVDGKQVR
ncbi:hypothetical protein T439DRAFT_171190 [Meredithblackwellia eburnea MCA 4105]